MERFSHSHRSSAGLERSPPAACWPMSDPASYRRPETKEAGSTSFSHEFVNANAHTSFIEPFSDRRLRHWVWSIPGCPLCKERSYETSRSWNLLDHRAHIDPCVHDRQSGSA